MKRKPNQLLHIDNNFYHLTAAQAKSLSVEGRLPKEGREIKADLSKLAEFDFGAPARGRFGTGESIPFKSFNLKASDFSEGWIKRTPLSYFNGAPVANRWVWAIQLRSKLI